VENLYWAKDMALTCALPTLRWLGLKSAKHTAASSDNILDSSLHRSTGVRPYTTTMHLGFMCKGSPNMSLSAICQGPFCRNLPIQPFFEEALQITSLLLQSMLKVK
jgi:hypothetical protein